MSISDFELALNELRNSRYEFFSFSKSLHSPPNWFNQHGNFKSERFFAKICLIDEHEKLNQSSKRKISWTDFRITVTHRAEIFITYLQSAQIIFTKYNEFRYISVGDRCW